ncbi:hypothetical protein SERLA73DRAFT_162489, partial [Serpula lacrymans var. lacrymans S7.3]
MRRIDGFLNQDAKSVLELQRHEFGHPGSNVAHTIPPPIFAPLPGPWGFLMSGYIVGLIAMTFILHRIQNIVVPPQHRPPHHQRHHQSVLRSIYHSIFPLDFSSSICRLIFRLPSLYFISKALFMWTITLIHMSDYLPPESSSWFEGATQWIAQREMEDLCWFTFCSVCGALCVEAITRGLEGGTSRASPFNLFGYAFLLHIYSSPLTHDLKLEGMTSRPDKHVIFTIILPLFQLAMVHFIGIRRRWSHQRLVPSSIISILSLTHFHAVLWFSESSYPLLNYMPCLFESILVSVTLLAIFLDIMTQILTEGSITRPLFGHHANLLPKWDEDFSIALLRLGTASLEASSVAGLGNEVGGVAALEPTSGRPQMEYGTLEMNRNGVTSISPAVEAKGSLRKRKRGFANEIRSIKAISNDGDLWIDMAWYRELAKFGVGVGRFLKGLWKLFWNAVRERSLRHGPPFALETDEDATIPIQDNNEQRDEVLLERFARGEDISDDEEDFEPPPRSRSDSFGTPSSASDVAGDEMDQGETANLYADFSSIAETTAPIMLAHMANASFSPLTRRRYNNLVARASANSSSIDNRGENWTEIASDQQ